MKLNKITLSFADEDFYLESKYQKHYAIRNKNHFRVSCLMSVFFFLSWIYSDKVFLGINIKSYLLIEIILSFLFFMGFLFSYSKRYTGYNHNYSLIYVILVGIGYCVMIYQVIPKIFYPLVFGISITYVFNYAFIRLRFLYSSLAGTILFLIIYILLQYVREDLSSYEKQVAIFFLFIMNALGMIISYTIEYSYRSEFYFLDSLEQEKEKHISKIELRLYQDEATGLYNRKAMEILNKKIINSNENGIPSTLAFLDLDQLKYVNDNFGHDAGDLYIETLGSIILENLRINDMGFRVGGDEFLIFLENCENSEMILERIFTIYSNKIFQTFENFAGSFSYGIVETIKNRDMSLDDLISIADKLMMENKRERKIQRGELNPSHT